MGGGAFAGIGANTARWRQDRRPQPEAVFITPGSWSNHAGNYTFIGNTGYELDKCEEAM